MDINSAVKRNNPVWGKNTTMVTLTIPALPAVLQLNQTGTPAHDMRGSYMIICNNGASNMQVIDRRSAVASLATTGILLAPGATFECAINFGPSAAEGIVVMGTATENLTVTYFA